MLRLLLSFLLLALIWARPAIWHQSSERAVAAICPTVIPTPSPTSSLCPQYPSVSIEGYWAQNDTTFSADVVVTIYTRVQVYLHSNVSQTVYVYGGGTFLNFFCDAESNQTTMVPLPAFNSTFPNVPGYQTYPGGLFSQSYQHSQEYGAPGGIRICLGPLVYIKDYYPSGTPFPSLYNSTVATTVPGTEVDVSIDIVMTIGNAPPLGSGIIASLSGLDTVYSVAPNCFYGGPTVSDDEQI